MTGIREAWPNDADGIHRVSSYLGYQTDSVEQAKQHLNNILDSDCDFVWVYVEDNTIKGWLHLFIALRLASPKFAEIGGLVVDESYRRSGVGKKLVEKAAQWSQQNQLTLRVRCNSNREEANKFYESLGFEVKKTQQVHELPSS